MMPDMSDPSDPSDLSDCKDFIAQSVAGDGHPPELTQFPSSILQNQRLNQERIPPDALTTTNGLSHNVATCSGTVLCDI